MRSFRTLAVTFSAPIDAGAEPTATDAATVTVAPADAPKPRKLPRKPRAAKPAAPAPVPTPTADPAPVAAEPAVRLVPIARTCATIARNATNFGGTLSDRDHAYITFYAALAKAAADGIVTVRAIADHGGRPAYGGSSKPHDAGVINRLRKAGLLTVEADGTSFAFTPSAATLKSYAAA